MRSIGSRRGNPILRAAVEQTARRRMESLVDPLSGAEHVRRDAMPEPTRTRAFFERIRERLLPRMEPMLCVDGAELGYFGSEAVGLWGMRASHGLVLACECADTPAQIVERARRWLACLRTRTTPGMLDRTWGRPVYGARLDPASDSFDVVWSTPGDWCRLVMAEEPSPRSWSLPPHWREPEFARS